MTQHHGTDINTDASTDISSFTHPGAIVLVSRTASLAALQAVVMAQLPEFRLLPPSAARAELYSPFRVNSLSAAGLAEQFRGEVFDVSQSKEREEVIARLCIPGRQVPTHLPLAVDPVQHGHAKVELMRKAPGWAYVTGCWEGMPDPRALLIEPHGRTGEHQQDEVIAHAAYLATLQMAMGAPEAGLSLCPAGITLQVPDTHLRMVEAITENTDPRCTVRGSFAEALGALTSCLRYAQVSVTVQGSAATRS